MPENRNTDRKTLKQTLKVKEKPWSSGSILPGGRDCPCPGSGHLPWCDPSTPGLSHWSTAAARKGTELSCTPATVDCKEVSLLLFSLLKLSQHSSEAWEAENHTGQHSRTKQKSRRKRLPILGWRVRSVGTLLAQHTESPMLWAQSPELHKNRHGQPRWLSR